MIGQITITYSLVSTIVASFVGGAVTILLVCTAMAHAEEQGIRKGYALGWEDCLKKRKPQHYVDEE